MNDKKQSGFSLVEVLTVVTIAVIISAFLFSGFLNFARYQEYNQIVSDIEFNIKQSHLKARSAEQDASHGIKFATGSTTYFVGNSFVDSDPQNEVTEHPLVSITTSLNGGGDEITFQKLTGLPSATGTITIDSLNYSDTTVIEITDTGVIQ